MSEAEEIKSDIDGLMLKRIDNLSREAEETIAKFINDSLALIAKGENSHYVAIRTSLHHYIMLKTGNHHLFVHSPTVFWYNANEQLLVYRNDDRLELGMCRCMRCDELGTGKAWDGFKRGQAMKNRIAVKRRRLDPLDECAVKVREMIEGWRDSVILMTDGGGLPAMEEQIRRSWFFNDVKRHVEWVKSGERALIFMMKKLG
jgi:hypothetical protein